MRISGYRFIVPFIAIVLSCAALAQDLIPPKQDAVPLKYDLRVGDHLIYRQTVERDVKSSDREISTVTTYRSHVLIVGVAADRLSVGRQRNRESAELRRYVAADGGGLEAARARFDERTAKSAKWFADAQEFGPDGASVNAPDPELTGVSKMISAIHAIEPLTPESVKIGDTWAASEIGGTYRVVSIGKGGDNTVVEVASEPPSHITERFSFVPQDGLITRAEIEGDYKMSAMTDVHTKVTLELLERRRGESPKAWLADPELRNAALEAYVLSRWLQPDLKAVRPLAVSSDVRTRDLARALLPARKGHVRKRKPRR
jgi:hypothetical protein